MSEYDSQVKPRETVEPTFDHKVHVAYVVNKRQPAWGCTSRTIHAVPRRHKAHYISGSTVLKRTTQISGTDVQTPKRFHRNVDDTSISTHPRNPQARRHATALTSGHGNWPHYSTRSVLSPGWTSISVSGDVWPAGGGLDLSGDVSVVLAVVVTVDGTLVSCQKTHQC